MNDRTVPIAIVGIACRFPGAANDPRSFWELISNKTDCIGPIPNDRWDQTLLDELGITPETQFARVGGFVDDIDRFDPSFFGISPREAAEIDPQQRMLLEMSWQCMEDAATGADTLAKHRTGVYVGVINHDHERLILADRKSINAFSGLGRSTSIAANRISLLFQSCRSQHCNRYSLLFITHCDRLGLSRAWRTNRGLRFRGRCQRYFVA